MPALRAGGEPHCLELFHAAEATWVHVLYALCHDQKRLRADFPKRLEALGCHRQLKPSSDLLEPIRAL